MITQRKLIILLFVSVIVSLITIFGVYSILTDIDTVESMINFLNNVSSSRQMAKSLTIFVFGINLVVLGCYNLAFNLLIDSKFVEDGKSKNTKKNKK